MLLSGPRMLPSSTASSCGAALRILAARPSINARSSAHATRSALPPSWIDRLPEVTPSSGLWAVLAGSRRILFRSTSSSSAAICASAVRIPCPSSTLPLAMDTVPSGSKCTRCDRRRASDSAAGFSASIEDRLHHAVVRAAAAEVLVEGPLHLIFRGGLHFRKKRDGAHDNSTHAVAALRRLMPLERLLHRMRPAQSLDRRDLLAGDKGDRQVARGHRPPVDQYEAGAALTAAAAEARAREAKIVAQHIKQRRLGRRFHRPLGAVDVNDHASLSRRGTTRTENRGDGCQAGAARQSRRSPPPAAHRWCRLRPRPSRRADCSATESNGRAARRAS